MTRAPAAARAAAARIVAAVRNDGRALTDVLIHEYANREATRPLTAALAHGAIRHYRALDFWLQHLLARPLARRDAAVHALLTCGVFELWQMRTKPHAVVAETVNAVALLRRAPLRGLVNAILRRFLRERDALLAALDAQPAAVRHSHPDWLLARFRRDWPDAADTLLAAGNTRAPMWLRVNQRHGTTADYAERVTAALGEPPALAPTAPAALRLPTPVPVAQLPGFDDGDVSVQDLAAQHVAGCLDARPGMRVLDACAAPGGKTAHLLECADNKLDLTALDIDADRLERVRETLARLRLDARCLAADAARPETWWDGEPFDRILIDAPCSGTGVIRRHPDIKVLRREQDIAPLARRQRGMLDALWPLLRPGGCLVYATCSVLREENHDVFSAFTRATADAAPITQLRGDNINGLMNVESTGMQWLPGVADADGFFISTIRKSSA